MQLEVLTRPVRDDDEPRFVRWWPRLSMQTRYRRFHSPVHRLSAEVVHRLVPGATFAVDDVSTPCAARSESAPQPVPR